MPVKLFLKLSFILTLIFIQACEHHDKGRASNNFRDSVLSNTQQIDTIARDAASLRKLNYENWDKFWNAFTTATSKKDTVTILNLTNFPFLQNASPADKKEFTELWISQTYDLEPVDAPVPTIYQFLQLNEYEKARQPKIDSVRYSIKNGKEFYYAQVNGYYRLVGIITPG